MANINDEDDIHIESGKVVTSPKHTPDWKLHKGDGDRKWSTTIKFQKKFLETPYIAVFFSTQDVLTGYDHRVSATADDITKEGFELTISTWEDSGIWGMCVSWLAYDKSLSRLNDGNLIQSGRSTVRKQTPGFTLHRGKGDRSFTNHVAFPTNYTNPPIVFVAVAMLDMDNKYDGRISVAASSIKNNGFDIDFSTWNDTLVYGCAVSWIAFDRSYLDGKLLMQTGRHVWKKDMPGYNLLKGDGSRFNKKVVNFDKKYAEPPTVLVCISEEDLIQEKDYRIAVSAENVTVQGFELKAGTWSDSQVWSITAVWLAFGKGEVKKINNNNAVNNAVNNEANKPNVNADNANNANNKDADEPAAKKQKVDDKKADEEKECRICFDNDINTVLIPCGHMCVCIDCSKLVQDKCPICKQKVKQVVKTFQT